MSLTADTDLSGSILISWSPPAVAVRNGHIEQYQVLYTTNSSLHFNQRPAITVDAVLSYKLTLQPSTRYYISVTAGTSAGFGPYANTSVITPSRCKYCKQFYPFLTIE